MKSGMPIDRYFDQSPTPERTENSTASAPSLQNHEFRHGSPNLRQSASRSNFTFSLREATTRIWQGKTVCFHNYELQRELQEIHSWPSAQQEATSVLDVRQFVNDIRVRHDLNFSRQITFSSSSTREQISMARRYFEAVSFELVLYLAEYGKQTTCACGKKSNFKGIKKYTNQLPRFFKAVRQTMKALIRDEHWLIVEQAIDVDLLMNQLRSGTSDLLSLVIWLGDVLKQSCSPIRDTDVDAVTSLLRLAMSERDGNKLASGITLLFDVFNTMKLVG